MKVGFGTVIYRESLKYCQEYIESINCQDCDDFDVILLNDNLSKIEIKNIQSKIKRNVILWEGISNSTPSELRLQLLKRAKANGYDLLILGDFDDTFSYDRVSCMISGHDETYHFFYNNIYYFNENKRFFNTLPKYTTQLSDLEEHNYLGLSNTALNLKIIDFTLIDKFLNSSIQVFDWFLFTIFLKQGYRGKKIEKCKTYYRIYENNIAGESNNTIYSIKKEIDIKINHYSNLKEIDSVFNKLLHLYKETELRLEKNEIEILENIDRENNFWWGKVKLIKERI